MIDLVTLCVKSFERPECLSRLLESITEYYPDLPVLVADDSETHPDVPLPARLLRLPYDTGLSEGRNILLQHVETPYFVLLDDDFIFCEQTRLELLLPLVASGAVDILGGDIISNGKSMRYHGWLWIHGTTLYHKHRKVNGSPVLCDLIMNFFLANTDTVRNVGWDPEQKMFEHQDFFLRCKDAGLRVGFYPGCGIIHDPIRPPEYASIRYPKARECHKRFMKKRSLTQIVGSVTH